MADNPSLYTRIALPIPDNDWNNEEVYKYHIDNGYDWRNINIIDHSTTATGCIKVLNDFVNGNGFKDKKLYGLVINKDGETADKFRSDIGNAINNQERLTIHIQPNALGQITSIKLIPSYLIRKMKIQKEGVNKKLMSNMLVKSKYWYYGYFFSLKEDLEYYYPFTLDPKEIAEQIKHAGGIEKYNGQIIDLNYCDNFNIYPKVTYHSALNYMLTEGEISLFYNNAVNNNFNASGILKTSVFETETEGGRELKKRFDKNINSHQSATNALKILHVELQEGQMFDYVPTQPVNVDNQYKNTDIVSFNKITAAFDVEEKLLKETTGNGFDNKIKKSLYQSQNEKTKGKRLFAEQVMKLVFDNWHEGSPSNDYTIDQLKFELALEDIPTELIKLICDPSIDKNALLGTLIEIGGYSEERAKNILGLNKKT